MKILHFSDFHLNQASNSLLKSQRLIEQMISALKRNEMERTIDLVLFTGDMVDVGGKSFCSIRQGFEIFKNLIVKKLMTELNLSLERFVFCPGNHDMDREKDNKYSEIGLCDELKDLNSLDEFYSNPSSVSVMQRTIPFKEFEKELFKDLNEEQYNNSNFQSNFIYEIDGRKVGITALNSSWRCWDSKNDKGRILMCPRQILDSISFLNNCDIRIALSHHSYLWMNEFEQITLEKNITAHYDMYFTGHTHSKNGEYCIRPEGRTFKIVAPGILVNNVYEDGKYKNGFSVIDYNIDEGYVETTIFYQNEMSLFEIDRNHGSNGTWHIDIPLGEEQQRNHDMQEVIISMKEELENLNHHLLSYTTNSTAPKTFNQIFVMPSITKKIPLEPTGDGTQEFEEIRIENLDDIINSKDNYIIFGIKESGKTILLDKILFDFLSYRNGQRTLPAFIQFSDIKSDIETCIRDFWHQKKTFSMPLIEQCDIILLVDDIQFSDSRRMGILKSFLDNHPNARLIATCLEAQKNDLILEAYNYSDLQYTRIEINEFNSKQIKSLTNKWIGNTSISKEKEKKVELLINAFSAVDLPRTPFAVSMFLWILERQENYKPQNNAILLKQFLETLLQSNEVKGAPREQFDYINKSNLLSIIAKTMLDFGNENYSLPTSKVIEIIEEHLSSLKFSFYSARKELKNFLNLGIFVEDNKSNIAFRFSCFFEYYLYVHMEVNSDFRSEVLSPANFLNYYNEIIYYTGIHRGEVDVLRMIIETLEYDYIDINDVVFKSVKSIDDFFNVDKSLLHNLTADDLISVLPDKQTESDKEKADDIKLNRQKGAKKQGLIEKKKSDKFNNYAKVLLLAMNVLKNSEEIKEEGIKKSYYSIILKNSISYMMLFKLICEEMINNSIKFPKSRIEDLKFCLRLLPVLHEELLRNHMGTFKLTDVIDEKIQEDYKSVLVSEMEQFLSVFLYIDLKGKNWAMELNRFVNSFKKAYIADACFFKLSSYYYESNEEKKDKMLLNNLSDLYIKIHQSNDNGKRINKGKIMNQLMKQRQQNLIKQKK